MATKKKEAKINSAELRLEYTTLGALKPHPDNEKKHSEDIGTSIERFGFADPPLVDERTGYMLSGHGRLEALLAMKANGQNPPEHVKVSEDGEWMIPVTRGYRSRSDAEASAMRLAVNKLAEAGGWDDAKLTKTMAEIAAQGEITGLGWSDGELDKLIKSVSAEAVDHTGSTGTEGLTPDQKLDLFENATLKQIVLVFGTEEFEEANHLLELARAKLNVDTNSEAVMALLKTYTDGSEL